MSFARMSFVLVTFVNCLEETLLFFLVRHAFSIDDRTQSPLPWNCLDACLWEKKKWNDCVTEKENTMASNKSTCHTIGHLFLLCISRRRWTFLERNSSEKIFLQFISTRKKRHWHLAALSVRDTSDGSPLFFVLILGPDAWLTNKKSLKIFPPTTLCDPSIRFVVCRQEISLLELLWQSTGSFRYFSSSLLRNCVASLATHKYQRERGRKKKMLCDFPQCKYARVFFSGHAQLLRSI